MMESEELEKDDKWEVDCAVRALMEAADVKANKELYAKAQEKMKQNISQMQKIVSTDGLRKKAKEVSKKEDLES